MKAIIVAIALTATACTNPPVVFETIPSESNFGPPPANIEVALRGHMENILREPESARYKVGVPYKAYAHELLQYGGKFKWAGYRVDFQVNARNGFGGYTGFQPYVALYENGKISSIFRAQDSSWTFTTVHK